MIDLKQAIDILESGDWCNLRFLTANVLKGTGGKIIELPKCRIARNRQPDALNQSTSSPAAAHARTSGGQRPANHNLQFTRNVELPNRQVRKVHPILITHINNKQVI